MAHYLDELHALGAELSLHTRLVSVSDEVLALAEHSPDHSPHRQEEPYRRALAGIYARLAATAACSASPSWAGGRRRRRLMTIPARCSAI